MLAKPVYKYKDKASRTIDKLVRDYYDEISGEYDALNNAIDAIKKRVLQAEKDKEKGDKARLQRFFSDPTNKSLLNNNEFEELYRRAKKEEDLKLGNLTQLLIDAGIEFIPYLKVFDDERFEDVVFPTSSLTINNYNNAKVYVDAFYTTNLKDVYIDKSCIFIIENSNEFMYWDILVRMKPNGEGQITFRKLN